MASESPESKEHTKGQLPVAPLPFSLERISPFYREQSCGAFTPSSLPVVSPSKGWGLGHMETVLSGDPGTPLMKVLIKSVYLAGALNL